MSQPLHALSYGCEPKGITDMQEVDSLAAKLKEHLPWHQARIIFMAQFMLSLLQARSVNLYRIAEHFQTYALTESSYRRIKRFFQKYDFSHLQLARLILHWLPIDRYILCMDRTNWQYGKKHVNYLVVSIAWQGTSIPVVWVCLTKKGGNSNTEERIALMQKVLTLIPADKIDHLLADREFIGQEWFSWLKKQRLLFRLRIRGDLMIATTKGTQVKAEKLFRHVKSGQTETWMSQRKVTGVKVYIAAARSPKSGELLIVVGLDKPESMVSDYAQRWAIEVLFGNLKSRGFDVEATHMTDPKKMDKLMGLLALTVLWCSLAGHWDYGDVELLPLNKHCRPQKSLFRLGLDRLRRTLLNTCAKKNSTTFEELLNVLSRT